MPLTKPKTRKRVYIESPYSSQDDEERKRFDNYLRRAIKDCFKRGEAPFASHGFYTIFLNDDIPRERELGMNCGFSWQSQAQLVAVYEDWSITKGMWEGIHNAYRLGLNVEHRTIGKD